MATKDISGSRLPAVVHRRRRRSCTYSVQHLFLARAFAQGYSDRIKACIQHPTHPASIIYSQKKCRPCSLKKTPGSGPAVRSRRPCSRPAQSPRPSTSRSARPRASDNARTERERAQGAHQCVHVKFCSSCAAVRRGRYTVFEVAPCSPTGDTRMRGP